MKLAKQLPAAAWALSSMVDVASALAATRPTKTVTTTMTATVTSYQCPAAPLTLPTVSNLVELDAHRHAIVRLQQPTTTSPPARPTAENIVFENDIGHARVSAGHAPAQPEPTQAPEIVDIGADQSAPAEAPEEPAPEEPAPEQPSVALPGTDLSVAMASMSDLTQLVQQTADGTPGVPNAHKCMVFTVDGGDFYWASEPAALWSPIGTGQLDNEVTRLCVPTADKQGGAMFVGAEPNPGPGSTKIEFNFVENDDEDSFGNISLVDGYSVSVTCEAGDKYVGGNESLWQKESCPADGETGTGRCLNRHGADLSTHSEGECPRFFQNAATDGNEYCIWHNCNQIIGFPRDSEFKCHVSARRPGV